MSKKGFTLVELLIVVAIISLLSLMSLFSIRDIKSKSHDTRRVGDIISFQGALAMYHNDYQEYPIYNGYITGSDEMSIALINNGVIKQIPQDPINSDPFRYYYQSTQGRTYMLIYYLETNSIPGRLAGENVAMP